MIVKNKKGIISELIIFMILSFVLVIVCVLFVYIGATVEDRLLDVTIVTEGNWTEAVETGIGGVNTAYNTLGWLSFMIIVFMVIAIFIGSWGVNTHPVFFIAYIFVTIVAVMISVPISNTYETLYDNPTLNPSFQQFGMSSFVFAHLPTWITVIGLIGGTIMVIRLARGREGFG